MKAYWIQPPVGRGIEFVDWGAWVDELFDRGITNPGLGGTSIDPDTGLVTEWWVVGR